MRAVVLICFGVVIGAVGAVSTEHLRGLFTFYDQPYSGQDQRLVASLSQKDIDDLRNGRGWGLAKSAELNGYPGPAHVLELKGDLSLADEQHSKISTFFNQMQAKAKKLGTQLIDAEIAVDDIFRGQIATPGELQNRLNRAARIRAELRAVHLTAHIQVTPLLSEKQRKKYADLRGYHGGGGEHKGH